MDNLSWIITGFGIFSGIAGIICSVAIPVLVIGGIGYFIHKRNQQSMAYRQATQSWQNTTGTVTPANKPPNTSGPKMKPTTIGVINAIKPGAIISRIDA